MQVILFWGLSASVYAQDTIPFSVAPSVTAIERFTLNDGLASNNLNETFIDSKGRMWVNPDVNVAIRFGLPFFQFDGRQSIFYDLKPELDSVGNKTPAWYILGETNDGFLFGSDRRSKVMFYWNPDTREQYFFTLEGNNEVLLNMVSDPNGGVLVLTKQFTNEQDLSTGTYHVYRLFEGQKKQLGFIQLDFKDDFIPGRPWRFTYPFEVAGDHAWFFHQRKGLVKVDLKGNSLEYMPWSDFEGISAIKKHRNDKSDISTEWKMIGIEKDKLLLFLGHQNGFYTLFSQNNSIEPSLKLNNLLLRENDAEDMLKVFFAKDKKKNLFITSGYLNPGVFPFTVKHYQAILRDFAGNWYDYTELMLEMKNGAGLDFHAMGSYFSSDFRYELGSTVLDEGMAIMDLQPDLKIGTFYPALGYELRSITILDSSTLLVNEEGLFRTLNLIDGSWKRLEGSNTNTRALNGFVRHEGKVWAAKYVSSDSLGLLSINPINNQIEFLPVDVKTNRFFFLNHEEIALFFYEGVVNEETAYFFDEGQLVTSGQLYLYNIETKTKRFFMYNNKPFSVGDKVRDIFFASDSTLWLGAANGLWQIEISEDKIKNVKHFEELIDVNIICIHQVEDGKLWLGTVKSGVIIFNPETKDIKQISEASGLANNRVVSILNDDEMNRWVATQNGISVIDCEGNVLFSLKESDGLANDHFRHSSFHKLSDGRLVFGGISGISILDPKFILSRLEQSREYSIYITEIKHFSSDENKDVVYPCSDVQKCPVPIPAEKRYLYLDFAISKYTDLQDCSYNYRILPSEYTSKQDSLIPWINLGAESQVTITNLPAGDHIVQIRGGHRHLSQLAAPLEIPIHVHEFFYRTWWFYLLVALAVISIMLIWIRRIQTEKLRLEIEVDHRTDQIQKDKATIEQQALQLKELDQAKTRFFTNISHEFRTPLTVILGLIEQNVDQARMRKLIKRNAGLLMNLVNQILDLRKLESGSMNTRFIQGNVTGHLQYILESFHSLAEDKGVLLSFEGPQQQVVLDYDPEKLLHIFSNLLVNAIKFTPEGGAVRMVLEVHKDSNIPFYQVTVADTGSGIPEEKLSHIFDRFYQVDDEVSRTGSGTGIGLTLVKELVKLLNGEIDVESRPGKGTTFNVKLPITNQADFEKEEHQFPVNEVQLPETWSSDSYHISRSEDSTLPHLLVVEDNADVAEYLATCLKDAYQLSFAADGQAGIDIALQNVPDIIISDVMMPKVDGFELCNTLKTDVITSHIPIVMLTAKADIESRITGLEHGADAYLAKPFDKRELEVQLKNLLIIRQKMRQRYASLQDLEPTEDAALLKEDEFIIRVRQKILANMTEESFGIPELCKQVGLSRSQLHNKIKSLTGRSTSHFIRLVRVEKACQLLLESELNVSLIAYEVGIESVSYFSRIFKEETGSSPSEYQAKYQS
ncbi:ATP-binding protein [Draconibacterium sp. IB214405]|nr:ATP-binding protein [Draconibacterium sp. IB214405]